VVVVVGARVVVVAGRVVGGRTTVDVDVDGGATDAVDVAEGAAVVDGTVGVA
jgi:hypothetical protein